MEKIDGVNSIERPNFDDLLESLLDFLKFIADGLFI